MSHPPPPSPASATCPTCAADIEPKDKFCSMCGTRLANASPGLAASPTTGADSIDDFVPLPDPGTNRRRRRKRKARWFKRPLIMVPLVVVLLIAGAGGVIAWQTRSAMEDVNSVSTPPPEVSGSVLGGDEDMQIDTGPAQAALAQRANRETSDPRIGDDTGGVIAPPGSLASASPIAASPMAVAPASPAGTDVPASAPTPPTPVVATTDGLTVLLMGVDVREGEAIDIGVRPDSLAVLHIDEATGTCRMLAVPRDSRTVLPGYGYSKINHALAVAGIPYEQLVVEEYLGVEFDHYALIDFAGLETVVDELGGITVDNPAAFETDGQTFAEGSLELDGEQALLYSRFRDDSQESSGRSSRQQQVLRSTLDKASSVNVVSTLPSMFRLLSDHFRTDFGVIDLVNLANDYRSSCTGQSIETRTIPGDVSMEFDDLMQIESSFVTSDPAVVQEHVDWLLNTSEGDAPAGIVPPAQRSAVTPIGHRVTMHRRPSWRGVIRHP